jgi:hypothetical protein
MEFEIKDEKLATSTGELMVGSQEFKVRTTFTGEVYINEKFYRQLCFTPNQVALALEDFLNGVPADE